MPTALAIVIRVAVVAVSLWVATAIIDGIYLGGGTTAARLGTLLVVSVIFGLVNAILKPLIKIVGCPLYLLTLGLIGLVVNALLFMLVGYLAGVLGGDRRGGDRVRAAPGHPRQPRPALIYTGQASQRYPASQNIHS